MRPRATGPREQTGTPADPWTRFYRETPEYFSRLYVQAVREWRKPPPALEEFPASGTVIDIGSGAGLLCALVAKRGADAVGLDVSLAGARAGRELAQRLELAGDRTAERGPGPGRGSGPDGGVAMGRCWFVVGDAQALPFREGVFAAAGHYATLEHLGDPLASLREAARVLAPGGRLVLFTVNALWPPRWRPALARDLRACARTSSAGRMEDGIAFLRRRGFAGPDAEAWRAGLCLDTWRIPAPLLRRVAGSLLAEERYETFHLSREGRTTLVESPEGALEVGVERPAAPRRALRRAYLWLNRVPLIRHLGPVTLWVGLKCSPPARRDRAGEARCT